MSRFTPIDAADKEAMKARALALKPRALNVVASAQGWSQVRPNGSLELLVSYRGLDELLGDATSDQDSTAEPVEVAAEEVAVEDTVADAAPEPAAAPKKAGRPKRVAEPAPVEADASAESKEASE